MNSKNIYEENLKYWSERVPGYSEVNKLELATVQRQKWKRCLQEEIERALSHHVAKKLHVLDLLVICCRRLYGRRLYAAKYRAGTYFSETGRHCAVSLSDCHRPCGVLCTGRNVEPGRHCGRGDYHVVRTVGKYSIVSTVFSINTLV